jgi:hypothetical protein
MTTAGALRMKYSFALSATARSVMSKTSTSQDSQAILLTV